MKRKKSFHPNLFFCCFLWKYFMYCVVCVAWHAVATRFIQYWLCEELPENRNKQINALNNKMCHSSSGFVKIEPPPLQLKRWYFVIFTAWHQKRTNLVQIGKWIKIFHSQHLPEFQTNEIIVAFSYASSQTWSYSFFVLRSRSLAKCQMSQFDMHVTYQWQSCINQNLFMINISLCIHSVSQSSSASSSSSSSPSRIYYKFELILDFLFRVDLLITIWKLCHNVIDYCSSFV